MIASRFKWISIASVLLVVFVYLLYEKVRLERILGRRKTVSQIFATNQIRQKDLIFISNTDIALDPNMNADEMDIAFFEFISKRHFACENSMRIGNLLSGGWNFCLAGPFYPSQPCLVYSFGIGNGFTFDDAVSKFFNCTVRCFDPGMVQSDHRRGSSVWFYKMGIGGENLMNEKKWKLKTLPSILELFGESKKIIDYLKLDVENSEWESLGTVFAAGGGDTLTRVKQLGVKFHLEDTSRRTLYERYQLLKRLEDFGFRRWNFAHNLYNTKITKLGFRSGFYEMVYINTRFLSASELDAC